MRVDNVAALSLQNIASKNRPNDSRDERPGLKINDAKRPVSDIHENREIDKSKDPNVVYSKSREDFEVKDFEKEVAIQDEDEIAIKEQNINASKSRIHDVNMAEEVISITKSHMLDHSSHAILAQSNKQPEQVLKLLE